jgi:TatD DNase family protein
MILVDTHTHLYLEEFEDDRGAMVGRAREAGVSYVLLPNIDHNSLTPMMQMVSDHPGFCYPMAGLHPTSVKEDYSEQLSEVQRLAFSGAVKGIGECGIDLYWDKQHIVQQYDAFEQQLRWSLELGIPVSIHIRDAFREVFEVLERFGNTRFKGVFHCFTGGVEEANRAIRYGFLLGIGGVVTFKNSHLRQLLKDFSPEQVVLESDAPFLAPMPFRGKRNEPAYLTYVAECLAGVWGITPEKAAEVTSDNACKLFNLPGI